MMKIGLSGPMLGDQGASGTRARRSRANRIARPDISPIKKAAIFSTRANSRLGAILSENECDTMTSNGKTGTYAVIGLGTFGATVARNLARFGNHVIGIDSDERRVSALVDDIGQGLIVDAREDGALREAGLEDIDAALVAMGTDIEASLLTVINLRTMGIKTVWAKATSKNHHRILSKLGVVRVIHPEKEVGEQIAQMMHNPLVRDFMSLGTGQYIVNFRVPARFDGKRLEDLGRLAEHDLRCVGVLRGTEFLSHDGAETTLKEDDLILLLGGRGDLRAFAGRL